MQEKLIIFISASHPNHPSWVILDVENKIQQTIQNGNSDELVSTALNKEIIVIIPAEDVLLTTITLPKMNRARLAQALPYALEEKLIGDVEALHLVSSDYQADGSLAVAVVAKQKMQEWMTLLQSWNLHADAIIPMTMTLNVQEKTWQILIDQIALIRINQYQGFACDINNLGELVEIAWASCDVHPQEIHIRNYTSQSITSSLNAIVPIQEDFLEAKQLQTDLAANVIKFPYLNLLQGSFKAKKSKYSTTKKVWNMIFVFATIWLCLLVLYPSVSYFILKHRANEIDQRIAEIYKRHFPESSSIVAPKLRMEEKLHTFSSGENQILLLMGYLGKARIKVPGVNFNRLDYQNNQITLELNAASSDDFSKFTEFLTQQGLSVKQQSANVVGERINATIVVR